MREQPRPPELDGRVRARVGADADEGGVTERHLAGVAEEQRQADDDEGVDAGEREHLEQVAVGDQQRQDRDDDDGDDRHESADGAAAHQTFTLPGAAEQALGPHEEHDEQHDEGDRVAVGRVDVAGGEALEHAEDEAAADGGDRVAEAAEDRRGEALDAHAGADVERRLGERRDGQAGQRAEARRRARTTPSPCGRC